MVIAVVLLLVGIDRGWFSKMSWPNLRRSPATTATPMTSTTPPSPPKKNWLEKNWGWLLIAIAAIVVILFFWDPISSLISNSKTSSVVKPTNIVIWRLNHPVVGDSSVIYAGPTPWEKVANYPLRITPECGKSVLVSSRRWDHQVLVAGCNPGTGNLPAWDWGEKIKISPVR